MKLAPLSECRLPQSRAPNSFNSLPTVPGIKPHFPICHLADHDAI